MDQPRLLHANVTFEYASVIQDILVRLTDSLNVYIEPALWPSWGVLYLRCLPAE